jgi:hypothetical protein
MLLAMSRPPLLLLLLLLLTLVLATAAAGAAAGLPCQPCAGIRLAAPPAPATATPATPPTPEISAAQESAGASAAGGPPAPGFDLLAFLRTARLAPDSPLFLAWEVTLPALPAAAAGGGAAPPAPGLPAAAGTGNPAQALAGMAGAAAGAGRGLTPGPGGGPAAAPPAVRDSAAAAGAGNPTPAAAAAADPSLAAAASVAREIAALGATPWLGLVFRTPAPLAQHAGQLEAELSAAAALAAALPRNTWVQIVWRPAGPAGAGAAAALDVQQYAFLLKRAAVTVAGAQNGLHVATAPLPADAAAIASFYGADVAAYLDLVALAAPAGAADATASPVPAPEAAAGGTGLASGALGAAIARVHELDPGRPVALDSLPYPPAPPGGALAAAARGVSTGIDLTLFQAAAVDAAVLNPLIVLAREFGGDISYDAGAAPAGAAAAWAFVRAKDLALRVIAVTPPAAGASTGTGGAPLPAELVLHFADPDLRRPTLFPLSTAAVAPPEARFTPPPNAGLDVHVPGPPPVVVLGIDRLTAAERQGVTEHVTVASQRELPVEEILKRLQVFEETQNRRLVQYTAIDTTHLRFQPNAGAASIEAALTGPFFWQRDGGADWAWETLYINGVRWRGKTLPQIPLIQPEKAAALPLEIHFTRDYRYRLRGTGKIDGRDAWVVDFAPAGKGAAGRRLYQGTVWIDRVLYSRLRTRAVELGLQGEVVSNEETLTYSPVDELGRAAPWSADSYMMPLHLVAEQILTVLDNPTVVERETVLTEVRINPPDFAARRQQVEATDVTMVRDTDQGLRYLVKKGDGPRVVKPAFAPSQLFALGGLFVDDSLSYPLPLGGIDYFTFDYKKSGEQVNVFFAGLLLVASASDPRLGGSHFNLGGDAFAIAVPFTDDVYSKGKELVNQEVQLRPATFDLKLGRPLGNFVNLGVEYGLADFSFSRNSNTAANFVLPSDNLTQYVQLDASVSRFGYTLGTNYSFSFRSSWQSWGLPGNPDYSPGDKDFTRYDFTLSKNWYLPYFQKIGTEVDYYGGDNLDRFSKYEFGFFGGTRIHGYRSNAVIASSAYLTHLSYGFDFGDLFRLEALADAALATDRETGLHNTLLAGTGLAGSFIGPWQTLITLDAGVPVAGPDHGFVLYLVFLRLFH